MHGTTTGGTSKLGQRLQEKHALTSSKIEQSQPDTQFSNLSMQKTTSMSGKTIELKTLQLIETIMVQPTSSV